MTGSEPLKEAGFYKAAEEVLASAGAEESPWESMAARYLRHGTAVLVSPHWVDDLVDGHAKRICQYATLTDGAWVWPSDLVYYLTTYHVILPEEFLAHMADQNWVVPELDDAELDAICKRLQLQYGAF